jgi:membrane-associated phospholipid phosphatase
LSEGRTASERALLWLDRVDPPWNIFPSFHAALCAILWRPAFGGRVTRAIMPIWMSLICAACVLTKQHQILDVAAGLVAGFAAIWAVKMFTRSRLMKRPRLTISMQYARAQGLPISIPPRANIERDGQ